MTIPVSLFDPENRYVINITLTDRIFKWALNCFDNYDQL